MFREDAVAAQSRVIQQSPELFTVYPRTYNKVEVMVRPIKDVVDTPETMMGAMFTHFALRLTGDDGVCILERIEKPMGIHYERIPSTPQREGHWAWKLENDAVSTKQLSCDLSSDVVWAFAKSQIGYKYNIVVKNCKHLVFDFFKEVLCELDDGAIYDRFAEDCEHDYLDKCNSVTGVPTRKLAAVDIHRGLVAADWSPFVFCDCGRTDAMNMSAYRARKYMKSWLMDAAAAQNKVIQEFPQLFTPYPQTYNKVEILVLQKKHAPGDAPETQDEAEFTHFALQLTGDDGLCILERVDMKMGVHYERLPFSPLPDSHWAHRLQSEAVTAKVVLCDVSSKSVWEFARQQIEYSYNARLRGSKHLVLDFFKALLRECDCNDVLESVLQLIY